MKFDGMTHEPLPGSADTTQRIRQLLAPAVTLGAAVLAALLDGSAAGSFAGLMLLVVAVAVSARTAGPLGTVMSAAIGACYVAAFAQLPASGFGTALRVALPGFFALAPFLTVIRPALAAERARHGAAPTARELELEHVLQEAGALTDASVSYHATLERVARLALPLLADWAVVYELPESGAPRRAMLAAEGRAAEEALQHAFRNLPLRLNQEHPLGAVDDVLRTAQPRLFTSCQPHGLDASGRDAGERLILHRLEPASLVMVPLHARGRLLGAMVFARTGDARAYTTDDVTLLLEFGRRAALAVDNARLFDAAMHARGEAEGARERMVAILDGLSSGFIALDNDGRVTHMNQAAERIAGRSRRDLLNRRLWHELPPASTSAPLARFAADAMRRRTPATSEFSVAWTGEARWLDVHVVPADDGVSLYLRDVTERRAMATALQAKEEALRQSQKMEAVGRLAGGIAHDFNNLLMSITGYAELLSRRVGPDDAMAQDIGEILRATQRASSLTRQLLTYSRKQVHQPQLIDVGEVIGEMQRSLLRLLGEDILLVVNSEPGLNPLFADPNQIEQILLNLAVNSRDSMAGGGTLTVSVSNATIEPGDERDEAGLRPGSYVAIEVSDTGSGIAPALLPHIFEPFFTTKAPGKGTGLGLASVYGIVRQNHGAISVSSVVGSGTTFRLLFPAANEAAAAASDVLPALQPKPARPVSDHAAAPAARTAPVAPVAIAPAPDTAAAPATGVILVAEDEDSVRRYISQVLGAQGYTVLEARTGIEGIAVAERYGGEIDLVLTDVVMPELGGRGLAEHFHTHRPGTRLLFMSGYAEAEIAHHGVLASGVQLLDKPFSSALLLERVQAVLAAPPAAVRFSTSAA